MSDTANSAFRPDVILHIGGRYITKRLLQFIDHQEIEEYILVKDDPIRYDPNHIISTHIESDIQMFCYELNKHLNHQKKSGYTKLFEVKAENC